LLNITNLDLSDPQINWLFMALKPTIYKCRLALSDLDRNLFDSHNLTIALHPSENIARMVARILAWCRNTSDNLVFCKGLSDSEEADLWSKDLNDAIELWIDVGEPAVDRIKKASRIAKAVKVYSFNSKSDTWWKLGHKQYLMLHAEYYQFPWEQIETLASNVNRTMDWSATISGNSIYVSTESGDVEVNIHRLQAV